MAVSKYRDREDDEGGDEGGVLRAVCILRERLLRLNAAKSKRANPSLT